MKPSVLATTTTTAASPHLAPIELSTYTKAGPPSPLQPRPSTSSTNHRPSSSFDDITTIDESSRGAHVESHIEDINEPYGLRELEKGWCFLEPFIQSKGYALRSRYAPGWVGSWVGTSLDPLECEDSIIVNSTVLDAVRVSDNTQVLLKIHTPLDALHVHPSKEHELAVLAYFSSPPLSDDPRNHCVPLLDVLDVSGDDVRISVTPLFRDWYAPPFCMTVEALGFIRQLLEGLEFMHEHGIAHCNIAPRNILMDARELFPEGFHGAYNMNPAHRMSESHLARRTRLSTPTPVRYYYIDFGHCAR
ncbi:hypothetical protein EW146_g10020, partial [Bondarzewia mesenterica]